MTEAVFQKKKSKHWLLARFLSFLAIFSSFLQIHSLDFLDFLQKDRFLGQKKLPESVLAKKNIKRRFLAFFVKNKLNAHKSKLFIIHL